MLKIGLLVNPVAGVGGASAMKGSDGQAAQARASERGGAPRGRARTRRAVRAMGQAAREVQWYTWGGDMGARALSGIVPHFRILGESAVPTQASDTVAAAGVLIAQGVDLLVIACGDGTLRDLLKLDSWSTPVLGIPSGVKMHSGVFATTPEAAGDLLATLVHGGLVQATFADVRDQDEEALRSGSQVAGFFGELPVPVQGGFLQHTKESGRENETQAVTEIVADVVERATGTVVLGPGSTCAAIKTELGLAPTLLGVDAWRDGECVGSDMTSAQLDQLLDDCADPPTLIVSFMRNQGFLFGRGNQQLSAAWLAQLPKDNLWVVGTRSKLLTLDGRPLLVDTDDPQLDQALGGLVQIIAGYEDYLFYTVSDRLPVPAS